MDGLPESTREFLSLLESAEVPAWSQPGDLGRLSLESFAASQEVDPIRSTGALRLSGQGVAEHSVRLDVVGTICQAFQRLVVSVGAATEDVKSSRGRVAEAIQRRARLNLAASPAPGSLVLHLTPEAQPDEDYSRPGMRSMLDDDPDPLADRSVAEIIGLLTDAAQADPEAEAVTRRINDLGPRAAGALSLFAETLAEDDLDIDLSWAQRRKPTRHVHLSAAGSRWLHDLVSARHLDETTVEFVGTLRTISDRRAIELEIDGGELIYVQPADQTPPLLDVLHLHQRVRVVAAERLEATIGGTETRRHTLIAIDRLDG